MPQFARLHLTLLILCAIFRSEYVSAQMVMESGAWEMKSITTAQNVKTGETKTVNESATKFCMKPSFANKNPYLTPGIDKAKMEQKKAKCTISDEKKSEDSASWIMSCTTVDGHVVDAHISNKISSKTLTSQIEQQVERDGNAVKVKILVNGTHTGKCSKEMPELE